MTVDAPPIHDADEARALPQYLLGDSLSERDRLSLQHEINKKMFGGKLVFAPVNLKKGVTVLDSACGTGAWSEEVAREHTDVSFTAVDLSDRLFTCKEPNVSFLHADILKSTELLGDQQFDLINQRHLVAGFNHEQWNAAFRLFFDKTKAGGWFQCGEMDLLNYGPEGSALRKAWSWGKQTCDVVGMEWGCARTLSEKLKKAGFVEVQEIAGEVNTLQEMSGYTGKPIAQWGTDSMHICTRAAVQLGLASQQEYDDTIREATHEFFTQPIPGRMIYAWGRKPSQ